MSDETDHAYYASRAIEARRMAQAAQDERIRAIHLTLAGNYDGLAAAVADARPKLRVRAR
jgi:hypothetical protein